MRVATLALTLGAVLAATGCSRFGSDSGLNPFGWMGGGSQQPTTLEPKGGWKTEQQDGRQGGQMGPAFIPARRQRTPPPPGRAGVAVGAAGGEDVLHGFSVGEGRRCVRRGAGSGQFAAVIFHISKT